MSETQEKKQLTPEERKALREKYTIHDKENETIYRHFGDLNGADFKLRKNKNCEIYILDWTKGMYIDDCEDCTIVCGPIDGSIFIRGSKNCKISLVARQLRFRTCENLEIFTYCPTDPAVESSFNIFFAPFNAFFPHLTSLFEKGGFKQEEKNHIDTPYDFTPSEVLGGGQPHFLNLPEDKFHIKVVRDGEAPIEEMYLGYSRKEPFIVNKKNELPKLGEKIISSDKNYENKDTFDELGFGINNTTSNNNQQNLNNIITMDSNNIITMDEFLSGNNNKNINNEQNINNNTNNLDFNNFNSNNNNTNEIKTNITNNNNLFDDMFSQNNNQPMINNSNLINNNSNSYNIINQNMTKEMEEQIRIDQIKQQTLEIRQERIRKIMEKEAQLKNEIILKAREYMNNFYEERKKRIEFNHQKLVEKENNNSGKSGNIWENLESNMTGSSSSADRMREAILNKNKQDQNK